MFLVLAGAGFACGRGSSSSSRAAPGRRTSSADGPMRRASSRSSGRCRRTCAKPPDWRSAGPSLACCGRTTIRATRRRSTRSTQKGTLLAKVAVLDRGGDRLGRHRRRSLPRRRRHDSLPLHRRHRQQRSRARRPHHLHRRRAFDQRRGPGQPLTVKARRSASAIPTGPKIPRRIAVLPNGDVTIVTKGRTPTISFFGFSKADIAKAL